MKKIFLLLIIGVFCINFAYALECQYKENESYQEFGTWLYYNDSGEFFGNSINSFDYQGGYGNLNGPCTYSFKIKNPFSYEISLKVIYRVYAPALPAFHGEVNEERQESLNVKEYSEGKISGSSVGVGGCGVLENETAYIITSPDVLISKKGFITKQREICKKCGNEICLNDGAICSLSNECGAGICNQDYKCGNFSGTCSPGKILCSNINKCVTTSIIENGKPYSCVEECTSGTMACNGICRAVSSKKIEQEYYCIEECKSRRGDGKKCLPSITWWIYFWIITLFAVLSILFFVFYKKLWRIIKILLGQKEGLDTKIDEAEIVLGDLEDKIRVTKGDLEKLKQKQDELIQIVREEEEKSKEKINKIRQKESKEIRKLEEKKKNKNAEAQRVIDVEINEIRNKRQKEIENAKRQDVEKLASLKSQIEKNEGLISEEREKEKKLREKIEKKEKEIREIEDTSPERKRQRLLNKYINEYKTNSRKIKYDTISERFIITSRFYPPEPLSRYIYKKKINPNIGNKEVHHINYDELIDETWNLIALSKEEHDKIKHSALVKGDWILGIEKIKENLGWEESKFPEHIKQEIKKRKEQSKLE